jgi:hypothetical protein
MGGIRWQRSRKFLAHAIIFSDRASTGPTQGLGLSGVRSQVMHPDSDEHLCAEDITCPVLTRGATAISLRVVGARARLTPLPMLHGHSDRPDRKAVPKDSHEERRGLQRGCDPHDEDRRLRRLTQSTSLALGWVDASAHARQRVPASRRKQGS